MKYIDQELLKYKLSIKALCNTQFSITAWLTCLLLISTGNIDLAAQQTVVNLNTPTPAANWTVPAGVFSIQVEVWGAGGGGTTGTPAGGGGGGGYARSVLSVTPGQNIPYSVGAGGAPSVGGQSSSFNSTIIGGGGSSGTTNLGAIGGVGSGGNSANFNGGSGGNGFPGVGNQSGGGGGGGSATPTANGGNGESATSGTGGTGGAGQGAGGAGGTANNGSGTNGTAPGGGGGGRSGPGGAQASGTGANGLVRITYGCITPITATVVTTNITCNGLTNGQIQINGAAGGNTGTFQYSLNGGTFQSSNTFTNLTPGAYVVAVRDAGDFSCSTSLGTFNINEPAILNASVTTQDANCFGADNGSITVSNPTGGNGAYEVSINGTNWFVVSSGSPFTFTGLAPSTFTVQIRDAAQTACIVTLGTFMINSPPVLSAVVSSSNVSCFGDANGTITVSSPMGGSGNFQTSINGTDWFAVTVATPYSFIGLNANNYNVLLRDANVTTCQILLQSVNIIEPAELIGNPIITQQPTCISGGIITLSMTGGTLPYRYNWADLAGTNNPVNRSGLSAGTYQVTVSDANGCTWASAVITLDEPSNCEGFYVCREAVSTINVAPIPGAEGYVWTLPLGTIALDGTVLETMPLVIVETTEPFLEVEWMGVSAGAYQVCVEPTNDCGVGTQQCINLFVDDIEIDLSAFDAPCHGEATGSIFLDVTQGVGPFTYLWSNGATVQDVFNLGPGTYNVTVTDVNGCSGVATAMIEEPLASLSVSGIVVDEDPFGSASGSITLTVNGGTIPYTYLWSNGAMTQDISVLGGGNYVVTVSDNNGCEEVISFTVDFIGGPLTISSIRGTDVLCFGASTGAIDLEIIGGATPYQFSWTALSGGPVPMAQVTNQDLIDLPAGVYQVTVTDDVGANVTTSIAITQPAATLSASSIVSDITCGGASNGSISLIVTGGTTPYSYAWNTGAISENLINLTPGTYTVTVTDANGCSSVVSENLMEPDPIVIAGTITDTPCENPNGSINLTVSGGTPNYSYVWTGPNMFASSLQNIEDLVAGTYAVTVTDDNGCTSRTSFVVRNVCIGSAKRILAGPTSNLDGSYNLTFEIFVRNEGGRTLNDVQIVENLNATFPPPATFNFISAVSSKFSINPAFNGNTVTDLLSSGQVLTVGDNGTIQLTVSVNPEGSLGPFENSITATGVSPQGVLTSDVSQDGSNPNPDNTGSFNNDDPTPINFPENPAVTVAKQIIGSTINNGNGTFTTSFRITIRNTGDVPLQNLQVTDNLAVVFGSGNFTVNNLSSATLAINPTYNGDTDINLLVGTDIVPVNNIEIILLDVTFSPSVAGPLMNIASASGTGPGGTSAMGSGSVNINFIENPSVGIAKRLVGAPINNNNGTYTLTYQFFVQNYGDVNLIGLQVRDDLDATFNGAIVVVNSLSSATFAVNPSYNGVSDINLLTGTDVLSLNANGFITLVVTVTPGLDLGPYNNLAEVQAQSPLGLDVDDISNNGTDPNPDNSNPNNFQSPTPVQFSENPAIGLAKAATSVTNNENGSYQVIYTILVSNFGDVPLLTDLQVTDNLAATFGNAQSFIVNSLTTTGNLTANPGFDGDSDINLLIPSTSTLPFGQTASIIIGVTVVPGEFLGPYANSATGTGTSPGGQPVTDVSTSGTNPDPDGDGNPTNNNTPTVLNFLEAPRILIAKEVLSGPSNNGDDTYSITYRFRVENTGDVPLYEIQIDEDLSAAFPDAVGIDIDAITITTQPLSTAIFSNFGTYDGVVETGLIGASGTLEVGEFFEVDLEITVDPNPAFGGPYANTAFGFAMSPGGSFVIDQDEEAVTLFENPAINIIKTFEGAQDLGSGLQRVTFRLTLENVGDVNLSDLQIFDDIAGQFAALNPTDFLAEEGRYLFGNPAWDGTAVSNVLEPGQSFDEELELDPMDPDDNFHVFISFTVEVDGSVIEVLNEAEAYGTGPLGDEAFGSDSDVAVFISFLVDLAITKAVDNPSPYSGETVTFTLTVDNFGPGIANEVVVTDNLPAGYTYISSVPSQGTFDPNSGLWTVGAMLANTSETLDIFVLVNNSGPYLNTATVDGLEDDTELDNNMDSSEPDVCRTGNQAPVLIKN